MKVFSSLYRRFVSQVAGYSISALAGWQQGAKVQLDNAAFLLDINDVYSFVEGVLSLDDEQAKKDMIKKGHSQLKLVMKKRELAEKSFCNMFIQYARRQSCWKNKL